MKQFLKICFLMIVCILVAPPLFAQKDFGRKVVDTLASPYMAGRGYVDSGCEKAAKYIGDQYKNFGLQPFTSSYSQPFHFPINTYLGKIEVRVDGKVVPQGADY